MLVKFFNSDSKSFSLKEKKKIKDFLNLIPQSENRAISRIHIIFMNDEELLSINEEFLKHNFYTDIITFEYKAKDRITAELYISYDRIRENSLTFKIPVFDETLRIMIHGVLHLCGYKDKKSSDKKLMTTKENEYLELWNSFSV